MVVWDREYYVKEAESQLGDAAVYAELENDPSEDLQSVIDNAIKIIRERGDIDDKTLDYLMVNNLKLGRFHLLPKIHKRLHSVPGRPVITNCGFYTENISQFVDHHLQPLAKNIRSYIKDTNHFSKRLAILENPLRALFFALLMWSVCIRGYHTIRDWKLCAFLLTVEKMSQFQRALS